jgi:hypothetical protein
MNCSLFIGASFGVVAGIIHLVMKRKEKSETAPNNQLDT